jgi:hypothetical protein
LGRILLPVKPGVKEKKGTEKRNRRKKEKMGTENGLWAVASE